MRTCLIISGGAYSEPESLPDYEYVIACDAGLRNALRMGIRPDLVMGDFDSMQCTESDGFPRETFPVEKDDTDTLLAIKKALSLGYRKLVLLCALGNRFDHTLANLQAMHYIASCGACGLLLSKDEHLETLLPGTHEIPAHKGFSLSLFSLSEQSLGVTIRHAKYEVTDAVLESRFPLGISNRWDGSGKPASISFRTGILLLVESEEKGL